ncbi:MAG: InlB B-repeat-containing protein [Treponema sp.]|nr:InlB B-repeat-containing protein [Treponema sp.]
MKINFLRKIIITILLTTVIISCQFSSDSNQKQNYTPSPSFFWGTWIRMDNGSEYYIDEKKVVTENKEFQIDAKNSDSSTLKIKNMTEFEKQSDSVIINDGIPYFRKGGTDLKYTLKLVGFDNVINSSFRAASGTSLGGVKAKGQSGKYPSYTDENISDDSGEITLISKTVDDENTVTIDTGDGVVVIPGIKIGNDGDFAGTIPLVGKDDYVLKITGEIPEEEKTDGYLYGNNFKSYPMKLSIKNVSEVTSAFSVCTISSKDPNLIITSNEPIKEGIAISTMKPGAEKVIDINVLYKSISAGYVDAQIDIQIQNAKTGLSWVDCVPLRFYKGLTPITVSAINTENNIISALNGFVIYPDGNSQFFQVPHNSYNTIYVPTFLKDDNYLLAFCGATVEGNLSESTEMFYTVNCGSSEAQYPVTTGADAIRYYGYGEPNETEDNAFFASKFFQAYLEEGEIDYYKISIAGGEISVPSGKRVYTLNYITEVGVSPETELFTQGDIVDENNLPVLKAENYIFDGWYFNGNKIENNLTVNNNIYLVAKWIPVDYSITYELNGGEKSESNPDKYNIQTETIILKSPSKIGYDFAGWYIDKEFRNPITEISKGSFGNKTIYAKWIPTEYLITYVLNEGTNNDENPEFYNIENETVILKSPSKQNYIFDGWYVNPDFENKIESIVSGSYGKIKLYAKWNPESFLINYELNGGTNYSTNPKIYNIESGEIILQNPEKNAYDFIGWYSDSEFKIENNKIGTGSSGNKTFYAKWKPVEYSITYVMNGGTNSESNPNSYNIETNDIILNSPSRTGYTFDGWYADSGYRNKLEKIITGSFGNKTIYAKWSPVSYSITYNLNGGSNYYTNPKNFTIESQINLREASKDGYTFAGWYTDSNFITKKESISKGTTGNVTLYAKWELLEYKIRLYSWEDYIGDVELPKTFTVESGIIELPVPDRVGYIFLGWYCANLNVQKYVSIIDSSKYRQDITLHPEWRPIDYTITYNLGDSIINDIYTINRSKELLVPEKSGYLFKGWYKEPEFINRVETIIQGTSGDIELYAKWEIVNYTISYSDMTGAINSSLNPSSYNVEDIVEVLYEPTKPGFKFGYWYEKISNDSTVYEIKIDKINKGSIGNKVLYAKWYNDSLMNLMESDVDSLVLPNEDIYIKCVGNWNTIWKLREKLKSFNYSFFIDLSELDSSINVDFSGFVNLTGIVLPDNMKTIGTSSFIFCSNLTYVELPKNLEYIGFNAFTYCYSLKSIIIPDSVSEIGFDAFWECINLEKVYLGKNINKIGNSAFGYCSSLEKIILPSGIKFLGRYAFDHSTKVCFDNINGWHYTSSEDFSGGVLVQSNDLSNEYSKNYSKYWYRDE